MSSKKGRGGEEGKRLWLDGVDLGAERGPSLGEMGAWGVTCEAVSDVWERYKRKTILETNDCSSPQNNIVR